MNKILNNKWILRSLLKTIWFNFHYLPFRQAIKLPILLYKPKFLVCKGQIKIDGPVHFGMITLGKFRVSIYPNTGIVYENWGGVITFRGKCRIGNASALSIGKNGSVEFGNDFSASTSLRLVCYHKITIRDNVLIGWNNLICDTDFHSLTIESNDPNKPAIRKSRGYDKIEIGRNTWLAMNCTILKGTTLPEYCVVGANSTLNKTTKAEPKSLLANDTAVIRRTGIYRDLNNDGINYE